MVVNGIKYNLIDDVDTLICKLQNAIDEHYYGDEECNNIEEVESDIIELTEAFENRDYAVMRDMMNKYHMLFKRYR